MKERRTDGTWNQPRLLLLGVEPVEYPALQIWAFRVVDSRGNTVVGAHSESEARKLCQRYHARYPKESFSIAK